MASTIVQRPIIINNEDYDKKTEPFTYNLPTINNWSVENVGGDRGTINDKGLVFTNNGNYHSPSLKMKSIISNEDNNKYPIHEYIFKSITLTGHIDYIDGNMNDLSNKRYGFLLKFEKKGFNADKLYINLPFKKSNITSSNITKLYNDRNFEYSNTSIVLNELIPSSSNYISYFYKEREEDVDDTTDSYDKHIPRKYEKIFITFIDTELTISDDMKEKLYSLLNSSFTTSNSDYNKKLRTQIIEYNDKSKKKIKDLDGNEINNDTDAELFDCRKEKKTENHIIYIRAGSFREDDKYMTKEEIETTMENQGEKFNATRWDTYTKYKKSTSEGVTNYENDDDNGKYVKTSKLSIGGTGDLPVWIWTPLRESDQDTNPYNETDNKTYFVNLRCNAKNDDYTQYYKDPDFEKMFFNSNGSPIKGTIDYLNSDGTDIYIDCEPVHEKVDNYEIIKQKDVYKLHSIDLYNKVGGYGKPILTMIIFMVVSVLIWSFILTIINVKRPEPTGNNPMFYLFFKFIFPFFILFSFIIHSVQVFKTKETKDGSKRELTYVTEGPESTLELSFMIILILMVFLILFHFSSHHYRLIDGISFIYGLFINPFPFMIDNSDQDSPYWFGILICILFILIVPTIVVVIMKLNQNSVFKNVKDEDKIDNNLWLYWLNLVVIMIAISIASNADNIQ